LPRVGRIRRRGIVNNCIHLLGVKQPLSQLLLQTFGLVLTHLLAERVSLGSRLIRPAPIGQKQETVCLGPININTLSL